MTIGWFMALQILAAAAAAQGDETLELRAARLEKMPAEQKEELLRKKHRFDELPKADQDRLRALHAAISNDPHAGELEATLKRYNQWLATLPSPRRAALLDIKDPMERIERIKELIQEQEEQRFRDFLPAVPQEDQEVIKNWLREFVVRHADEIRERLRPDVRRYIDEAPEPSRLDHLFRSWEMRRREPGMPSPSPEDLLQLLDQLSPETRDEINRGLAADERRRAQQQQRVGELVRAAQISRSFPQPSREELLKFYANMKPDDQRRERLEGLEGDSLYRELQRQWNIERWRERAGPGFGWGQRGGGGGPPGGRGGPGGGGPRDDREREGPRGEDRPRPDDGRDGKGFGGKRPPLPGEGRPPPPGDFPPPPPPPREKVPENP